MNIKNLLILLSLAISAHSNAQISNSTKAFNSFEERFLDAYWKQNTSAAISVGYSRYYENLQIPDPAYFASTVSFSKQRLDSLHTINFKNLNGNDKISYRIIENQLKKTIWELEIFKIHQWDASRYNLGASCFNIITRPYAPLDERLKTLSKRLLLSCHLLML